MCCKCSNNRTNRPDPCAVSCEAFAPGPGSPLLQARRWRTGCIWHYANDGILPITDHDFSVAFPEGETQIATRQEFPELYCVGTKGVSIPVTVRIPDLNVLMELPLEHVHIQIRRDGIWLVVTYPDILDDLQSWVSYNVANITSIEFIWSVCIKMA